MAEDQAADIGGDDTALPAHSAGGNGRLSVAEAARSLADWHNKQDAEATKQLQGERSEPPEGRASPPADQSAEEADANPEQGHGETPEAEAQPEAEPIEPPVSWKAAEKERWQAIPRETQEYIVQREMERERHLTSSSKEAAEQLKGMQAREQALEQARLQYEQMAAASLQALQQQLAGEFPDIKTMEDVKALAANDWARYLRWDAHQKDIAAKMTVAREAQLRQAQEQTERFSRFAAEADKQFIQRNPEFADPEKAAKIQAVAVSALRDVGFSEEELGQHWNGQLMLSMRDPRVQSMFADAARFRLGQQAAKKVAAKPLPPVQRPGVAQPAGADTHSKIQSLQRQLDKASGITALRLATQLHQLQREVSGGGRS